MSVNSTSPSLPQDLKDQVYVSVKPIVAGSIFLPHKEVFQDAVDLPDSEGLRVPSFSFLISHPTQGSALFDLGIRKNLEGYPPHMLEEMKTYFDAKCDQDVAQQLIAGGVQPDDVRTIILSHLHWDHIGDTTPFRSARVIIGAPAKAHFENNLYPQNPEGSIPAPPEHQAVQFLDFSEPSSVGETARLVEPFPTFERALDLYGDGSMYLVDTPGHFPGHIALLARVEKDAFVFLAGDLCINRECYAPGHRLVSELNNVDLEAARDSARKLAELDKGWESVVVVLAHEVQRLEEGMPLFPDDVRGWVLQEIEKRRLSRS